MSLENQHVTDPAEVSRLFNRIASRYDLLNRMMSLGQDMAWRASLVRAVADRPGPLLDLCTGTGDVALELKGADPRRAVIGVDASLGMMRAGRPKDSRRTLAGWVQADAVTLPIRPSSLGAVTVAFGVRNVARLDELLVEVLRVMRPGGRLAVLEIFSPRSDFLGAGYDFYLRRVIPAMGTLVGGDGPAYRHLAASVKAFGRPEALEARMTRAGFTRVQSRSMNMGTIGLVQGDRP